MNAIPLPYGAVFELAPEAMALVDAGGRVLRVNGEFTRLFGFTAEEVHGRRINDVIVPAHLMDEAEAAGDLAASGRRSLMETVRAAKDGRLVDVSVHCTPIQLEDGTQAIFSIYRDIAQRIRAEQALRLSEEKFAKAFRAGPDAMVISTLAEGRILEVNERYVTLFGFGPRHALVGRTVADLGVWVNPADRERMLAELRTHGYVASLDMPLRTRASGVRLFQLSAEPLEIEGEACWLTVCRDVTDIREATHQLLQSRSRLRALAARLDGVREEERAAVAREVHDELGQELTGLRLDLSWLQRQVTARSKLAERIHAMVGQVDGTIDTVRRIASELRPGPLDELGLVAAVEWQCERFRERSGHAVHLHIAGEDVPVDGRLAISVFRILQEALTNVSRHAKATSVEVTLEISPVAVTLAVEDDGCGIASWEAASARGLGLLGMRERALQWEGEISIEGASGHGTCVRLVVPQVRTGELAIVQ